jgi:V8-like Glu-specific endopeptidase
VLKRTIALAVALLALSATAASAIVGGRPDTTHTYVGAAITVTPQGTLLCSGVLVGPTTFVTAAHCIIPGLPVFVVMRPTAAPPVDAVGDGVVDPSWSHGATGLSSSDRDDVAVVKLRTELSGPYAQLPSAGYDDGLPNNQAVDVLGYGLPTPGIRQIAAAKIIPGAGVVGSSFLKISASTMCNGDSGGPVLQAGTDLVLAINSYGASASCAAVGYAQRLDTPDVLAFVNQYR